MLRCAVLGPGFRAGAGRLYQDKYGEVPDNVFVMVSVRVHANLAP